MYACKARKYGTLLYRPNTDLILLLQQSLSKLRQHKDILRAEATQVIPSPTHRSSTTNVLYDLNSDLLDQCQRYLSREKSFIAEYASFDISREIQEVNPTLWNAISIITTSAAQGKDKQKVSCNEQHKKRVRQYFMLCCMMYSADDRCCMPICMC